MLEMPPPSTIMSGSIRLTTSPERSGEAVFVGVQRFGGGRVAAQSQFGDGGGGKEPAGAGTIIGLERRAGEEGFDTAGTSAETGWRFQPGLVKQGQGVVAPLAGGGIAAFVDLAAERQAAAAAGAEDGGEDDIHPGAGAVKCLGCGEAVGVVGAADGAAERLFQIVAERLAGHPDRVGAFDQAGRRADRSRHSDADGSVTAGFPLDRADDACDGFDRCG